METWVRIKRKEWKEEREEVLEEIKRRKKQKEKKEKKNLDGWANCCSFLKCRPENQKGEQKVKQTVKYKRMLKETLFFPFPGHCTVPVQYILFWGYSLPVSIIHDSNDGNVSNNSNKQNLRMGTAKYHCNEFIYFHRADFGYVTHASQ